MDYLVDLLDDRHVELETFCDSVHGLGGVIAFDDLAYGLTSLLDVGAFAPRTEYVVTFLPGLRGDSQAVLAEPVSKTVQTPGLKPMLRFLGRARYLPRLQGATLRFEARNAERLRVSMRQIFPQNLIFWLTKNRETASGDVAAKAELISKAVLIVGGLEGCINHKEGGELADNLSRLYQYMSITLTEANIHGDIAKLNEVSKLLLEIKSAWVQIPGQTQQASA